MHGGAKGELQLRKGNYCNRVKALIIRSASVSVVKPGRALLLQGKINKGGMMGREVRECFTFKSRI